MKLIVKRLESPTLFNYKWEIIDHNGERRDFGFADTVLGARWAAFKAWRFIRKHPNNIVFEKELSPNTEKNDE